MCEQPAPSSGLPQTPRRPLMGRQRLKRRRKLWDLDSSVHCPVIGTCLDVRELRRLAAKARCHFDGRVTDYDVHVRFVASVDQKNPLSLAAHKALEKKYSAHVRRFAGAATADELAALWADSVARGDVPGALWALLTHPRCDDALRTRAFEEVHMLSHQVGAGQRADLKRLAEAHEELAALRRDFDELHTRSRQQLEGRDQHIHDLESVLAETRREQRRLAAREQDLTRELDELRTGTDIERLAQLEQACEQRGDRLARVEGECERWRAACEEAERRAGALDAECRERAAENAALERIVMESFADCGDCDLRDCSPDLGGRRILCVGGRIQLIDHYRALVSRYNGEFEHHDGGLEDKRQRLESMLSAADAVVCATDCVSHDAYHRLKRFCKRHAKPHVFLQSSGLTSFARAVESIAG